MSAVPVRVTTSVCECDKHTHTPMQRKPHGSRPIKPLIREPVTDGAGLYTTLEMALESFPQSPTAIQSLPSPTHSPLLRATSACTVGHAYLRNICIGATCNYFSAGIYEFILPLLAV